MKNLETNLVLCHFSFGPLFVMSTGLAKIFLAEIKQAKGGKKL